MKVGDVVLYQGVRWKVLTHNQDYRTCILSAFNGSKAEVPDDLHTTPDLKVLFTPATDWPFVAGPVHARAGRLIGINRGDQGLTPLVDWIPSDFLRPGGSIFFSPTLRLRQGEILVGLHEGGVRSRIAITKSFGTMKRRRHLADNPAKVKGPPSTFDRLMGADIFEED